jgi:hypothetical protein
MTSLIPPLRTDYLARFLKRRFSRRANAGRVFVRSSCSQIRITRQPRLCNSASTRRSRAMLSNFLRRQNAVLDVHKHWKQSAYWRLRPSFWQVTTPEKKIHYIKTWKDEDELKKAILSKIGARCTREPIVAAKFEASPERHRLVF